MSWIRKIINYLFLTPEVEKIKENQKPTVLDNVWIKDENNLYVGFIWGVSRRKITVTFYKDGEGFIDETFLKSDIKDGHLHKNNLTIYLEKPCSTD